MGDFGLFSMPFLFSTGFWISSFFLTVKMKHCLNDTGIIGINNPNFIILEDGSLYTKNAISLTTHESIVTVFLKNIYTHEQKRIYVSLLTYPQKVYIIIIIYYIHTISFILESITHCHTHLIILLAFILLYLRVT